MSRYSVGGLAFDEACKLLDELKNLGIEANLSVGNIAVFPKNKGEIKISEETVKKYKGFFFKE